MNTEEIFDIWKSNKAKAKIKPEKLHKDFFYCTNHASKMLKLKLKSAGDEFDNIKQTRSRDKILERLEDKKIVKLKLWLSKRSLTHSLPAFNDKI